MTLHFNKFQGAGNDFILLDIRKNNIRLSSERIKFLCDRHFGVGADGLITLGNDKQFPFFMRYYNSDGFESTMCGNGGRCIALFANELGLCGDEIQFNAIDGIHQAILVNKDSSGALIRLKMKDVPSIEHYPGYMTLNTGSPHYVSFRENIENISMQGEGRSVRYSEPFAADGINVNLVEKKGNSLFVRTYERGVEDETLSCGTGVTASVLAAASADPSLPSPVKVLTLGGTLTVYFERKDNGFTEIWLEGPAVNVYSGIIDI
jgi:diaminopimelate epimerase